MVQHVPRLRPASQTDKLSPLHPSPRVYLVTQDVSSNQAHTARDLISSFVKSRLCRGTRQDLAAFSSLATNSRYATHQNIQLMELNTLVPRIAAPAALPHKPYISMLRNSLSLARHSSPTTIYQNTATAVSLHHIIPISCFHLSAELVKIIGHAILPCIKATFTDPHSPPKSLCDGRWAFKMRIHLQEFPVFNQTMVPYRQPHYEPPSSHSS